MRIFTVLLFVVSLYADIIKNYNIEVTITPNRAYFVYDFDYYIDSCCISFYSALKNIKDLKIEGDVTEYKKYNLKNFLGIEIQNKNRGWHHYKISYFVDSSNFYYPLIQWKENIKDFHLKVISYKPFVILTPKNRYISKDKELNIELFNVERDYLVIKDSKPIKIPKEQILNYHIIAKIDDLGEMDVVEEIEYFFAKPKHGIYRYIPLRDNKIELKEVLFDGQLANYKSWIKNQNLYIKIGDPDILIDKKHKYKISYVIKHLINSFDEKRNFIFFNAIGKGWSVPIKKATIDLYITPKIENFNILSRFKPQYIDDHHLRFKIDSLSPNEQVSFKVIFNKDYFDVDILKPHISIATIFFIIASIFIYLFYKRYYAPNNFSISPQYYPPKLNVLKSGLIMDGVADFVDLGSAILELAVRGYLKIEIKKRWFFKKIKLIKLKEPEGLEYELRLLFRFLFGEGSSFDMSKIDKKRAKEFKRVEESIAKNLYFWALNEGYFEKDPRKLRKDFVKKVTFSLAFFHFLAAYEFYTLMPEAVEVIIFITIFVIGYFFQFASILERFAKSKIIIYFGMVIGIIFPSLMLGKIVSLTIIDALFLVAAFFVPYIRQYTQKGEDMAKYILGFKEFVKRVEKDKIERLLKDDPNYLDKVIPYALLFGYLKEWEKLYEIFGIKMKNYEGSITNLHSINTAFYGSSQGFGGGSSRSSGSGGGGGGSW